MREFNLNVGFCFACWFEFILLLLKYSEEKSCNTAGFYEMMFSLVLVLQNKSANNTTRVLYKYYVNNEGGAFYRVS